MSTTEPLVLAHVIHDVLDQFTPTIPLRIIYNNRLLLAGAELKPSAVASKPRADVGGSDMRAFYTLVSSEIYLYVLPIIGFCIVGLSLGARGPPPPSLHHYDLVAFLCRMVTDIPETTSVSFGQELVFYERPEPRSGIHRMVFVLFRQLGRGTVFAPEMRHNFNCRSFARQYHLSIATATYFNCQREAGSGGRRFRDE
ncbi:hypothetical protein PR202_ga05683 [Eleusine coracana subsp. coracana]|uniref:Uncharacterized protein n=1 Tax=Eleusine coracana subsp. coracana TaxID=191504 RepID=A0AAV5BU62_ELECO|nr:hypothetical protein PR202_ga05229 [Eleusine coracana subsp. coracana]GJM89486.1 hypothetical protein PR202_ga05683 [Eleusine coracana subsp. coracana]